MSKSNPQKEPFRLYHLSEEQEGQTLSAIVRKMFEHISWGEAKQKITGRYVQVNGNLCLDHARRLSKKDVVKIWEQPLARPIRASDVRFAYVDSFMVVVEKPAGVTSVRHFEERNLSQNRRQLQPTLDELIPEALANFLSRQQLDQGAREPRSRPHFESSRKHGKTEKKWPPIIAVHRLDRDTSGLMLFARTQQTADLLGRMFRKHTIDRRYWAVIYGEMEDQKIESYLVRDVGGGRRGSTPNADDPEAQHAITHVRSLERLGDYSVIECKLETGRTHQIRIHLADAGHRLCGETIYNRGPDGAAMMDVSGAPRQALHSASLRLTHPITGEQLEWKSKWPPDLNRWLRGLRK